MNIIKFAFLSVLFVFSSEIILAKDYTSPFYRGKFLSAKQAEVKWGKKELEVSVWKTSSVKDRSAMAASLLKNKKKYIGRDNSEIIKMFGPSDSHYISDLVPAYLIQEYSEKTPETWELVFLIDAKDKITDIRVHRQYPR